MKNLLNKTLEKPALALILKKMLEHFENHGFYQNFLKFNGSLLKEHVDREWMLNNFYQTDEPVFFAPDFETGYQSVHKTCDSLPVSFVYRNEGKNLKSSSKKILEPEDCVRKMFDDDSSPILKKTTICSGNDGMQFLYKQQRDRKIWWRKLSSLPGRFGASEIVSNNETVSVELTADFPWGIQTIETITQSVTKTNEKNSRKTNLITSRVNLHAAVSTYMCDAYDALNEETTRDLMRFHRKLAPYKITFAINGSNANITQQLRELALVLARKIRKNGIACLLLPDAGKRSLESNFLRADAFGIPYTIVLNDKTLSDGILGIRNRDTTLKEQSHVGILVPYVEQLMKNY